MIKVYKQNIFRTIPEEHLEAYLAGGWSDKEVVAEVITLKPAVKSKGTVKEIPDNANLQGDE